MTKVGTIAIIRLEGEKWSLLFEDTEEWWPGLGGIVASRDDVYDTPGAALDAAVKWCKDRGLTLAVNSTSWGIHKSPTGEDA